MRVNKAARFLCVLAALLVQILTVNATIYYHSDHQRDSSLYETAASVKTESSNTCRLVSGVHEVCQSAQITENGETRYFHVCPSDGDPCNQQKCYYSSEPLCCRNALGLNCIARLNLLVGDEITKVTFNRISFTGEICVSVSPAVNACDADCDLPCQSTDCVNNVICDSDGTNCRCKEGYGSSGENDCCNCAEGNVTHRYYKTNGTCTVYCRSNCRSVFPATPDNPGGGPCQTCRREGFLPPLCCDCDTTGNDTHAFYKTPDGQCIPFCKQNCAVMGDRGCDECNVGYVDKPECCDCDTTGNATHAFYRIPTGECKPFCKSNCAETGDNGCDQCKVGYVDEPECCDCDTIGNATHAFYRTSTGECKPFCKQNCASTVIGEGGCDSCKVGYVSEPECCDCDTTGNETHSFYRTADGKCLPFCKRNCASTVIGERGCDSCKVGYVSAPECCDCDTIGNATHAFYRTPDGKCLSFCKQNCAETGGSGCNSCKVGYVGEPECCDCDTTDNAFYKTPDGKCLQSTKCVKDQDLYFLIDATDSNNYFCHVISVVQVLVAAFNPSSSSGSGTKIMAWLFGIGERVEPSLVFDSTMSCKIIVDDQLVSLISEYEECLEHKHEYRSKEFASLCGDVSSAVSGLEKIADEIERRGTSRNRAMVILTDAIINDKPEKLRAVFNRFGDTTIIAGGIKKTKYEFMEEYIPDAKDNIIVEDKPIPLGRAIVDRLEKTGVLCTDLATDITEKLNTVHESAHTNFCNCHRQSWIEKGYCTDYELKYPQCGGDLTFGIFKKQPLELEEEILAAVESVLENYSE